jgi:hypothetical protein
VILIASLFALPMQDASADAGIGKSPSASSASHRVHFALTGKREALRLLSPAERKSGWHIRLDPPDLFACLHASIAFEHSASAISQKPFIGVGKGFSSPYAPRAPPAIG